MRKLTIVLLLAMMACASQAHARENNGGGGGGGVGGALCRLLCYAIHGSCTISNGDPDLIPLKDPFCEQRRAQCIQSCTGSGGGGIGVIGQQPATPDMLMSPVEQCDQPVEVERAG